MPRYEVVDIERKPHITQLLFYIAGSLLFALTLYQFIDNPVTSKLVNLMVGLSILIYIFGRIYGDLGVQNDYVEINSELIRFRSTPSFGNGWLPVTKEFLIEEIKSVNIVEIQPFYDVESTRLSLELLTKDGRGYYFGNNLKEEQIIKIGLTLKGTVTLSKTLSAFLGSTTDEVGDQIQDLIKVGKSLWSTFQQRGKGE